MKENREIMDKLAAHLIEKETITGKEFMKIYRKEKGLPEPMEEEEEKAGDTRKVQSQPQQGGQQAQTPGSHNRVRRSRKTIRMRSSRTGLNFNSRGLSLNRRAGLSSNSRKGRSFSRNRTSRRIIRNRR